MSYLMPVIVTIFYIHNHLPKTSGPFFNNITQGLKKDLVGRHFVYKSEYGGETIGVVADVYKESVLNFDAVTEYNITKYLSVF